MINNILQPSLFFCSSIDDVQRYRKGLPLRIYDAFLLYVSADEEFAKQLITTLEGRFNLRVSKLPIGTQVLVLKLLFKRLLLNFVFLLQLCEKDRDFRGGIDIEWSAIFKIISKRCRKLLVILSPEFLQSDYHTYFVQLTQSLTFRKIFSCSTHDYIGIALFSYVFSTHKRVYPTKFIFYLGRRARKKYNNKREMSFNL